VARIPEPARPTGSVRLAERDCRILAFAAEHRLVLERQLERLVDVGPVTLRSRLRALVGAELLRAEQVFGERHYQIRPAGLAAIDSKLPPPKFKFPTYKHDVGVAWLWLAAHRGRFGPVHEVLAERVLRSHDGAIDHAREPYGVRLGGFDRYGNEPLHYPDLLLIDPYQRRLALELELTSKGRGRRERILAGYGADGRIDRVLYVVEDAREGRATRRLLEGMTREMGLSDRVRFQFIKPLRVSPRESPEVARRAVKREAAEATL
jgi:hypothetical protein